MEFKDATAMAEAVRDGQVSPKELVIDTIRKANALNPDINAIISTRYEKALKEADKRDFTDKPFAGVPIYLKDLGMDMKDELSGSGSILFKDTIASKTDYYVQALEDLGFIILGKTNTPEYGFKNISDSRTFGIVNLPFDKSRNAGGSSGAAAALISAGITVISPASDGGGSIRIPASFNGLIGLKTSRGRIPSGPNPYRRWQGAAVQFAITKSVRDTRNLLYYLQDCQLESPFPLPILTKEELFDSQLPHMKVAYLTKNPDGTDLGSEAKQAVLNAVQFLKDKGYEAVELESAPIDMKELISHYYVMNSVETASMFAGIEKFLGRPVIKADMEPMTWAIYQSGQMILAKDYTAMMHVWDNYSAIMDVFHKTYDLLLTPTTHDVAPKHGQINPSPQLLEKLANAEKFMPAEQMQLVTEMFRPGLALNPYTPLANLTGQPAINLPTHQTKSGLPLGIQFMAAKGREDLLLQVAQLFEDNGKLML
ncbi:amidase [Streptococcus parauberis]|uniref:amidase n=1 Tax=Streptococcus parauberis TaxID=1348 RepID=UPI000789B374|nr:amidase [Streptococcus parauberis]KYP20839.1 6-aminohexanoate-cyclic-dimer hydrolase [Streptococcus parauberis]KYP21223.1 6-aminohexanoate-cyclic-dimer hydrolase [Streptococcus parauberis]KYP22381.1 6-aminohexanoate-cyclic-dimer hydrolase [Streptococcus parauberis]KYP24882.1 6-aminohexanoate-cyclic-dimer hydrolase [Streptococcus parauberis]KYP25859.1 6-aminohexanoate-cyclic-dimer hydrolase [Streptococcus parauberis]